MSSSPVPPPGCLPCCKKCVFTDEFENGDSIDIRWKTSLLSGGTSPTFSIDDPADRLISDGDGSLGILILEPRFTDSIYVEAEVLDADGGATATGVIIGKAENDDRITLVRVWGTADGYELRQGDTVLEAFTSTEVGPIKLEIVSPFDPTTDIRCYVGGVLEHTEAGVAWEMPGLLYAGAYAEGGGKWEYVTFSPCPKPLCNAVVPCSEFTKFPLIWTLDATAIGNDDVGYETFCQHFSRNYTFLISSQVVAYQTGGLGCVYPDVKGWVPTIYVGPVPPAGNVALSCSWFPVFPTEGRKVPGLPDIDNPALLNRWPLARMFGASDYDDTLTMPYPDYVQDGQTPVQGGNPCGGGGYAPVIEYEGQPVIVVQLRDAVPGEFPNPSIRIRLRFWMTAGDVSARKPFADYYSPWVDDDGTTDYTTSDTVLTLYTDPAATPDQWPPDGCDWPETLTLVPNGNLEFARRVADCDPCSECDAKTKKRGWQVDFEWQDEDAEAQFHDTRLWKCLTAQCVGLDAFQVPPWQFRPNSEWGRDCGWILCGSAMRACQLDDFDAFGFVTNPDCVEYTPPSPSPSKICCRGFNRAYVTLGYNHIEETGNTVFELIIWTPNWDRFDGVSASGNWSLPLVRYSAEGEICNTDTEVTFTKTLDNTIGTLPNSYSGLPYFPETIKAHRIEMPTDCDGPVFPEPEPFEPPSNWCPGDEEGEPPAELCFGVSVSGANASTFVVDYPPPETDPPKLTYDGGTSYSWSMGTARGLDNTFSPDPVFTHNYEFTVYWDGSVWKLDWSEETDYPSPGFFTTFTGTETAATFSCTPEDGVSVSFPPLHPSGTTSVDLTLSAYVCPASPAMPSKTSPRPLPKLPTPPIKRKTPDDLPCKFRGGYLNTIPCCGDVYQCKCPEVNAKKVRACTINRNSIDGITACDGCPFRKEPESADPSQE